MFCWIYMIKLNRLCKIRNKYNPNWTKTQVKLHRLLVKCQMNKISLRNYQKFNRCYCKINNFWIELPLLLWKVLIKMETISEIIRIFRNILKNWKMLSNKCIFYMENNARITKWISKNSNKRLGIISKVLEISQKIHLKNNNI